MAIDITAKQFGPTGTMHRKMATIWYKRKLYPRRLSEMKKMDVHERKERREIPLFDGHYYGLLIEILEDNMSRKSLKRFKNHKVNIDQCFILQSMPGRPNHKLMLSTS